ncbi:autotransporter outer membrane beta-barrel domain-containing protein [Aporhodopirellula aestuarii]|uniref:Uncharacterized protein n=1 Tax=Aporhodopirellula aestuarii TaxID=2950107 RepID=A0ABT0UBJ5_9BACT|nr:hypothetical protein [Aporhodopirellula aestuarii]MCM2373706.1 hypothetical protein [Aporhodopirellula aestuarii]
MNIGSPRHFRSILDALLGRWVRGDGQRVPNRVQGPWVPRVRSLEPRIVLNATAELAALGDLVISGDAADDFVDVSINASGRIEIFDANAAVIPIRVGTDNAGAPIFVDSLDPSEIVTGRLSVDLGGGDDTLLVDVPVDLSVTVVDDLGNDSVNISLNADAAEVSDNTLNISAETINIDGGDDTIDLSTSTLNSSAVNGSIVIEDANAVTLGDVSVTQGGLQIGESGDPLTGNVTQAPGTNISVGRLEVHTDSGINLSQTTNSIAVVDEITSQGNVVLHSDATGLPNDTMIVHDIETLNDNVRGDISITVVGSVDLISSDPTSDTVLATANGQINVNASDQIRISDFVSNNNDLDVDANHEIIAGGEQGRIAMSAGQAWIAGDSVQIHARQISDGAVTINAPSVELGDDFEINTGNGIGVARRFGPRPELIVVEPGVIKEVPPGVITDPTDPDFVKIETAFYDVESIMTDILTQANANDAKGVFSVEIGVVGENGLTLSIDWGGQSNRFQRLEDLPGDHTRVDVSHVYLESDILNSRLNGRPSATDPLAVRFAVSHHDSIVINGNSIQQTVAPGEVVTAGGASLREDVPGELISSTDDPRTTTNFEDANVPDLESGRAFFVIPRVDLPPAFFAVRNVIPDPIDPPPPIILTSTIELSNVTFETAEASASPLSIREEYFQLRTLSPDPQGDDQIEPIRLPDNIMSEDQLSDLFAELPDGSYEIQYVIGESDQRTILRVDLRGGRAVILSEELETGSMELELIEGEDFSEAPLSETQPSGVDHEP